MRSGAILTCMVSVMSTLLGCAVISRGPGLPATLGEQSSGFGYVPLDGLASTESADIACPKGDSVAIRKAMRPLLEILPDISVRFAVASFAADGALSFGPAKITSEGHTYRAVLDYVNVDAIPVDFYVKKTVTSWDPVIKKRKQETLGIFQAPSPGDTIVGYEARIRGNLLTKTDSAKHENLLSKAEGGGGFDEVTIPIYIGIGMRLSADIRALKSGVALTSLGAIAGAAQANALSGTLTVQTIGVTGKSIATALPLPSKLDQTTVENGILALGSSRALIYNAGSAQSDVVTTARVVGLYSPVGSDPALINTIYSELSRNGPPLNRPCGARNP
jgi:hypothetical protein